MEQSRVEELEALLAEAIPQVVIGDSKNDRTSLSDYRRNLAAARERYNPRLPFLVHDIELEIQDPNIQARALDLIRTELEPYLDFTHFKRHKRGNLQYDGTEWRGVSVHRSWRSIVKNPPTPTTSGYAQR